jgi:precorrin-8X/cobalt-precorrin-8 methylmutase
VRDLLGRWGKEGRRTLVGLDFAFGYPRGFAAALQLPRPAWQGVLNYCAQHVHDAANNLHNRDAFAAACNTAISTGPGPFWGCHAGAAGPALTTQRVGLFAFPHHGLAEYRITEQRVRSQGVLPQSVWKLNQGVSVGGQTILGIKHLAELRFHSDPTISDGMRIWPFETGWAAPGDVRTVIAEIFPSIVAIDEEVANGVPDLTQVRSCVRHAASLDRAGQLLASFDAPGLTPEQSQAVLAEEGWILFA